MQRRNHSTPHIHTAINRVWCSVIFIIITIPGLRLSATHFFATHSHPRIYLLHLRRCGCIACDCNWRAQREREIAAVAPQWAQFGCSALRVIAQMEICRYLRVCREHFQIMQFSCLVATTRLHCFEICVEFIPES